jgi:hypothetical protein
MESIVRHQKCWGEQKGELQLGKRQADKFGNRFPWNWKS